MMTLLTIFLVYTIAGIILTLIIDTGIYALLAYGINSTWDWRVFWSLIGGTFIVYEVVVIFAILIGYFTGGIVV